MSRKFFAAPAGLAPARTPRGLVPALSLAVVTALALAPTSGAADVQPSGTEDPTLATASSRSFWQDDGSVVKRIYGSPVNVKVGGAWKRIDPRLTVDGDRLRNVRGDVQVSIPRTLSGGRVEVADGAVSATLAPVGLRGTARVTGSSAGFAAAAPGVAASYASTDRGVRETLELRGAEAPSRLDFLLTPGPGLTVRPTRHGGADIVDVNGKRRMVLSPSFAWAGRALYEARNVPTRITRSGRGWRVRLDLGAAWIRQALKTQTVTVDPTLTIPNATQNATLLSANPDTAGWTDATGLLMLSAGARSTLHFDVSSVPEGARVLDAKLALHGNPYDPLVGSRPRPVSVHEMTGGWTGSQATWNSRATGQPWTTPGGDFLLDPAATVTDVRSSDGWTYWHPTTMVQRWVSGTAANNGMMLVGQPNSTDFPTYFDAINTAPWEGSAEINPYGPYLQIRYAPPAGRRRDDTYLDTQLNARTTMGVGVATGNLLLSSQDVSIAGLGQPLSLTRSYNTGLVGQWTGAFGNGGTGGLTGDVRLEPLAEGGMMLRLGDGSTYRYPKNGTGFTAAARLEADLVRKPDDTFELTYRRSQAKWRFAANGLLTQVADKNGNTISLAYTTGVLTSITDTQGRVLDVTVNLGSQITRLQDPSGRHWDYAYASVGTKGTRLTKFTDPEGGETLYAYDSSNRLRKITTPGGRVTTITYDPDSRVSEYTQITDPDAESGPTTTLRYDQDDPRCPSAESVRGTIVTDPRGNETLYCSNDQLQVIYSVDAKGHAQSRSYTSQGQVQTFSDGVGTGSAITTNGYDGLSNNLQSSVGPMGETTSYGYKAGATSLTDKYQPESQTDADQKQQFFGYDANGNMTSVRDNADPALANMQASLTYNPDGTIATAKDGENRQTGYGYFTATDGGSRRGLLKQITPAGPLNPTTLDYDTLGRVTSATDGNGKTTTYTYDKLDRVKTIVFDDDSVIAYGYDADGNTTQRSDTAGGTYGYGYDDLGRRTSESLPGGRAVSYGYDAAGNLTSLTDGSGTTGYGYDELNRTCFVAPGGGYGSCLAPPSGAITMSYDALSHRTQTRYPNGVVVDTPTDLSGKPTAILATKAGTVLTRRDYTYSTFPGGKTGELLKTQTKNGASVAETYSYDGSGHLAQAEQILMGGTTPSKLGFGFDRAGNRKTAYCLPPWPLPMTNLGATYNSANQLVMQTLSGTPTAGCPDRPSASFAYDGAGNDLRFGYNDRNQTTSVGSASLGYAGPNQAELIDDDGRTIENNLLGVGRRISGGNPTAFVRDPSGELLARKAPGNVWSYYVHDHLDSVIAVTDAAGAVSKQYDYDPDGNTIGSSSGKPEDFGYTGAYVRSGAQALYHNGLRWYDPRTARWTQPDPLDQPGDLQNANRYAYVGANPLNWTDPLGLALCTKAGKDHGICNKGGRRSGSGYPRPQDDRTYVPDGRGSGKLNVNAKTAIVSAATGAAGLACGAVSGGMAAAFCGMAGAQLSSSLTDPDKAH